MKTILVDGMFCIYDKNFKVNEELLKIVNSFIENSDARKILVVNGFSEKGKEALAGNGFEAFSLEEEGIKKNNPEYFKRLILKFKLDVKDLLYFDHNEENVETAKSLGIKSVKYLSNEQTKEFLEKEF